MPTWRDTIPFDAESVTPAERARMERLTEAEIERIDEALLSFATDRFRKVAMIVGKAMGVLQAELPALLDVFYAERVARLVAEGALVSQGDLRRMRFSEVRLPTLPDDDEEDAEAAPEDGATCDPEARDPAA